LLPVLQLLYKGTALVVICLTIFWLALIALHKLEASKKALAAARLSRGRHATAQ
jgi:hypothetical protein